MPTLRRISELGDDVITNDLKVWLSSDVELDEQKNAQYFSLITNDPERGALTDQELHNLHSALNYAFEQKLVNLEQYTIAWMMMATGLRPSQIARLKRSDVVINDGPEGHELTLKVALIKGEKSSITDIWPRRAPTVLSDCLKKYLQASSHKASSDDYLFLANLKHRNIGNTVKSLFKNINTWSDRLEGPIPVNAYRFRYTLATRALRQGASDYEVARLLTHRSTSCIQYYRASMPELQQPINNAIGKEMDYFAKAFQGTLIRTLNEATYPEDGEQQILDFMHLTGQTLGACGTRTECHLNAPVACLSCHRFEPLEDAPWEELLGKLKEDQAIEKEERIRMINHNAMSSIVEIMTERDKRKASRL
jgi:integrase